MGSGTPSVVANQDHKPIHFWVQDKVKQLNDKYTTLDGYGLKQTIVRVLDSENEEDQIEIEKNKKILKINQKNGQSVANFNVKIKKRYKNLNWFFDRPDTPKSESPQKD